MDKNQIAETVTKSALNLIPGVGGAIASILGDYLSVRKEARLNEFIRNYFDEINQKQDCIVREYVCSDDFLDIYNGKRHCFLHLYYQPASSRKRCLSRK